MKRQDMIKKGIQNDVKEGRLKQRDTICLKTIENYTEK